MTRIIIETSTHHVAAMSPNAKSVQIYGFLSLLIILTCEVSAASQPTVLELILDSLKNIEDIIRESAKPTIYLTSTVGRNHLQRQPPPREVVGVNEARRPEQSRTVNWRPSQVANENLNSDRYTKLRKQPEDDIMPFLLESTLNEKFRRSFTKNSNENRNVNTNVNSNSNNNYAKTPANADLATNLRKINGGGIRVYGVGARSLSRNRNDNRNVNRNVNTNTNTNSQMYY